MNTLIAPAKTPIFKKYLGDVSAWHGYVRFLGLPSLQTNPDIPIEELYVPLALSERQVKTDEAPSKWSTIDPVVALAKHKRLVILGDPGSGKSTLINWFAWYLASGFSRSLEGSLETCLPIPFVLRDLDLTKVEDFDSLLDSLLQRPVAEALKDKKDLVYDYIRSGKALLLFDGLDEISYDKRVQIRNVIQSGIRQFPNSYYLFTSRIVGYDEVPIGEKSSLLEKIEKLQPQDEILFSEQQLTLPKNDSLVDESNSELGSSSIKVCYVAPFNDEQVSLFALNWYREQGGPDKEARQLSRSFVSAIRSTATTNQLARTPNLLTMMALIFRIRAQLPDGTALLYEDIAQAYLESIDSARQLKDEFSWLRKKRWLARVGFEMQMQRVEQVKAGPQRSQELLVSRQQVLDWISDAMLVSGDKASIGYAEKYLDWITKRSGLLVPRGENQFAFLHLSFQEYFCAVYVKQQLENPDWRCPTEDVEGVLDSRVERSKLEDWATANVWHQTLVFLFELFAGMPGWPKTLMGIFFPKDWNSIENLGWKDTDRYLFWILGNKATIRLRCWLQIICNPHSGLQQIQLDSLFLEAFHLAMEQQRILSMQAKGSWQRHVKPNILVYLLMSDQYGEMTFDKLSQHSDITHLTVTDIDASRFKRTIAIFNNLKILYVDKLKNDDVQLISKYINLNELTLSYCELNDLDFLQNFHSLTKLSLSGSTVTNPHHLEKLPQLEFLNIDDTNISTLEPLTKQQGLLSFSADRSEIQSLRGLENSIRMTSLSIQATPIEDFTPLALFKELSSLFVAYTQFSDLRVLSEMTALHTLFCHRTKIENLESLNGHNHLAYLNLSNTVISDLTPISKIHSLENLILDGTRVINLSPLVGLTKLKSIDLDHTNITSVSALAKIPTLHYISIRNTKIRSVRSLERLLNLTTLDLDGTIAKTSAVGIKLLEIVRSRKSELTARAIG